jgi:hypothetical protein
MAQKEKLYGMSLLEASGLLIGDKGYIDSQLERQLSSYAINLQTPKRSNMKDKTSKGFVYLGFAEKVSEKIHKN